MEVLGLHVDHFGKGLEETEGCDHDEIEIEFLYDLGLHLYNITFGEGFVCEIDEIIEFGNAVGLFVFGGGEESGSAD
jgi:hypothetical protein